MYTEPAFVLDACYASSGPTFALGVPVGERPVVLQI